MFCCNDCKGKFSPLCGILCGFAKTMDAFATLVWLFSSVHTPHVDRQLAGCDAWKATLWTSVRLFPRVGHLVFCKGIFKMWGKVALVSQLDWFSEVTPPTVPYDSSHITPKEVKAIFRGKSPTTAPGEDGLLYGILAKLPAVHHFLATHYNKTQVSSLAPKVWAGSIVKLCHKAGSLEDPSNFLSELKTW